MSLSRKEAILFASLGILVIIIFAFNVIGLGKLSSSGRILAFDDPAVYSARDNSFSIYGACLDGLNRPLVGATAVITIFNSSGNTFGKKETMTALSDGIFNYVVASPGTAGNYFVQVNCSTSSGYALGHSNFQVAAWTDSPKSPVGFVTFGGDGSNGSLTVSSATTWDSALKQFVNLTISSSITTSEPGNSTNGKPAGFFIGVQDTLTINSGGNISITGRGHATGESNVVSSIGVNCSGENVA